MKTNITTLTDSYKLTHHSQYPRGTEAVYSYFESRKGARFDTTTFFGLQYWLKEYLEGVVVSEAKIQFAKDLAAKHFGNPTIFNEAGWRYILEKWGGRLPVRIKAVPEGTEVPVSNVMMTIENTDPNCFWLTNHLETILVQVWSPCTVATLSKNVKRMIGGYLEQTAENAAGLPFMLHDFGFRGVSSIESAGIAGAAHLVNFMGTDTVRAIEVAMQYYGADVCAYSVPATEHSVMTSYGPEGEEKIVKQLLDRYPAGILSVVGDSYNIFRFADEVVGTKFHDQILERDGVFVVRPDSGDPVGVVTRLLEILGKRFGKTKNAKGYNVLNPKVRILWGDGLEPPTIKAILHACKMYGWSAENLVFGMGGGLLQKVNRDTQRFAFKCSAQKRNGEWIDIFKDPIDGSKKSKRGRLALERIEGAHGTGLRTVPEAQAKNDLLEVIFENGEVVREYTFNEVRENAAS